MLEMEVDRFRRLNEEIIRQGEPAHRWIELDLVCECSDETCFGVVSASAADLSRGCIVAPGHDDSLEMPAAA